VTKDTITWIEGVGDKHLGLLKSTAPDGGHVHSCTHLSTGEKLYINEDNDDYCNCTFRFGQDEDNDGAGNYIPRSANINLVLGLNIPGVEKNYKVRACDTLKIISSDTDAMILNSEKDCAGDFIEINLTEISPAGHFIFTVYDILGFSTIYLSEQCDGDFARISIQPCFQNDCNDSNPNINPSQLEDPYNGEDDDCDPSTLDDDLDQDGFSIADDCNDTDSSINPDAVEIPNNGIDEDCDGNDFLTFTHQLANTKIDFFPNPVISVLQIQLDGNLNFEIQLFDIKGKLILKKENAKKISLEHLKSGIYFLELRDVNSGQKIIEKIILAK
jgi:hypothetical protein